MNIVKQGLGAQRHYAGVQQARYPPSGRYSNPNAFFARRGALDKPNAPSTALRLKPNKERFNQELARLAEQRRAVDIFAIAREMKEAGVKPNTETYDHLLRACGDLAIQAETWAVFEDMMAVGVTPTRNTFHHLLHVR